MKCAKCGHETGQAKANFCPNCGTPFGKARGKSSFPAVVIVVALILFVLYTLGIVKL
ncbi:MAG: zinc ribbon domain-containing protein [Candidatus Aenigmarchaeota archaeon]|nr:zinc ribbon domain-containing protein [Candidatus Aenigmarchaeota archaeon]